MRARDTGHRRFRRRLRPAGRCVGRALPQLQFRERREDLLPPSPPPMRAGIHFGRNTQARATPASRTSPYGPSEHTPPPPCSAPRAPAASTRLSLRAGQVAVLTDKRRGALWTPLRPYSSHSGKAKPFVAGCSAPRRHQPKNFMTYPLLWGAPYLGNKIIMRILLLLMWLYLCFRYLIQAGNRAAQPPSLPSNGSLRQLYHEIWRQGQLSWACSQSSPPEKSALSERTPALR